MNKNKSIIFAHRGDSSLAPENSISAGRSALNLGAKGLEADVRMCASGELVLFHDKTLFRHFNKSWPICMLTWTKLKELHFRHSQYSEPIGITLLNDYLEEFKGSVPLILDIKTLCGRHIKIVKTLIRTLERMRMLDQIWVSAFDPLILTIVKKLRPQIRTGFLFSRFTLLYQSLDIMLKSDAWHPHYHLISDALMERAQKLNKEIFVWTVNDLETIDKLSNYHFEGIITDTLYRKEYDLNRHLNETISNPAT